MQNCPLRNYKKMFVEMWRVYSLLWDTVVEFSQEMIQLCCCSILQLHFWNSCCLKNILFYQRTHLQRTCYYIYQEGAYRIKLTKKPWPQTCNPWRSFWRSYLKEVQTKDESIVIVIHLWYFNEWVAFLITLPSCSSSAGCLSYHGSHTGWWGYSD